MGVAIGGLLGGPIVGIGAGLIAGLHRLSLGGFTAWGLRIFNYFGRNRHWFYGETL